MNETLVDVAVLRWEEGLVSEAGGACEGVLGAPASALVGTPINESLGISREQLRELGAPGQVPRVEFMRARIRGEPAWIRISLGTDGDGRPSAAVMNMDRVLTGAPPLQIFRLSSSLSHEIRNPLSSVKMAVQTLARNTGLSERDQRRLVIANREVRTMERMLSLLSEYGRDSPPVLEVTTLRNLVQDAAAQVKLELDERKTELLIEVEGDEGELPKVRADAARLRPVLAQLLLNVAHGQPEGSQVRARLRRGSSGRSELLLNDPSAAPPPEEHSKIFEPFASFLSREAGLSLAALYRVMKGLGGGVSVSSVPAEGTVYTLSFPT